MSEENESLARFGFVPPPPFKPPEPIYNYPSPSLQKPLVPVERVSLTFPTLRQFQVEGVAAFFSQGSPEKKHASVILPTGAGKTIMALKIWDELGQPDMLIAVPLIVNVMNPWLQNLKRVGINPASIGTYYSEDKSVKFPITITVYKSLVENSWLLREFKLIVFDEEDILQSGSYNTLLEQAATRPYLLGMTATVQEAIKRNPLIGQIMPVVYERTIFEARKEQILAPAEVIPIFITLTHDERTEYNRLYESYLNQLRAANSGLPPKDKEIARRRAFMIKTKMLILLSNAKEKFDKVIELAKEDKFSTTLVFSSSIDNIETIKSVLNQNNINSEVLKAAIKREDRQRILDNLGRTYTILLSAHTIERGFDVPSASREIIVGGGTSLREAEQRLGRVLRVDPENPDKVAQVYVIAATDSFDMDLLKNVRNALTRIRSVGLVD